MSPPTKRPADWLRAVEALALLIAARLALSVLPVGLIFRSLRLTMEPAAAFDDRVPPAARPIGLAIDRAARRLPGETRCLPRALAGALMLRRRRLQATVVLGVRSKDGLLKAHAWLLSAGAPVLGAANAQVFVPLAAFSGGLGEG